MCLSEWEDGRMSRRTGGGLGRGGRTSDPLSAHIVPRLPRKSGCPTPATQKWRSPRDTRGTPGRTFDPLAVHIVPRLPRKCSGAQGTPEGRQRDARAYIRPLGSAHCPTPATQKQRSPRDTRGTPGRTSDPLAVHIVPRLPRVSQ